MSQEPYIAPFSYNSQRAALRARLEEEHDTSTYQKRDLLWQKAWAMATTGLLCQTEKVEFWYAELVELLP